MTENAQTLEQVSTQSPIKRKRGRPTKVSQGVLPTDKVKSSEEDKDLSKLKAQRLNSLLKVTGGKFDTLDDAEYRKRIETMSLTDLQNEAMRVGLKPNITNDTRSISIDTLMGLFYDNKRSYVPDESGQNQTNLSDAKREKLLDLMKVGR